MMFFKMPPSTVIPKNFGFIKNILVHARKSVLVGKMMWISNSQPKTNITNQLLSHVGELRNFLDVHGMKDLGFFGNKYTVQ